MLLLGRGGADEGGEVTIVGGIGHARWSDKKSVATQAGEGDGGCIRQSGVEMLAKSGVVGGRATKAGSVENDEFERAVQRRTGDRGRFPEECGKGTLSQRREESLPKHDVLGELRESDVERCRRAVKEKLVSLG